MQRLAIITTHPIQYYAPVFKLLHERQNISIKVFYTCGEGAQQKFDPGFGKNIVWDIPLLVGYPYEWVQNIAKDPGSHHSKGINNPGLIEQVTAWDPGAILVYGWFYKSHLKALRYFKNKIPVIFRGDSTLLDGTGGFKGMLRNIFLKWIYSHVDHALYTGTNNKAYFIKLGLKEAQLTFAPHAVDNERFAASRTDESATLRKQLGIGANEKLVLFAGKFESKKAPELLLRAFIEINLPDIHLLFVGNGVLDSKLKKQAVLYKNIHFIGFQNQQCMPVIYQACDLFCLPSKGPAETWGLAVNEAMACKKAVLLSDKCGCAVDLVTKENGHIFTSENMAELAAALKELLLNREILKNLGERSGSIIKSWSFINIVKVIEKKISQITDGY